MISVVLALLPGCVEVEGGAVELSWKIRTTAGEASSCTVPEPDIARMRVCWSPVDLGAPRVCDGLQSTEFPCTDEHGVTGFVIGDGRWQVWIEPVCPDGLEAEAGRFEVPPPIVRDVALGQVATLSALLVVAEDDVCAR